MMNDLRTQKTELRNKFLRIRSDIPDAQRAEWDAKIHAAFFNTAAFRYCSLILAYASVRGECDTIGLIKACLERGKRVALPVSDAENFRLEYRLITDIADLETGKYDIPAPDGDCQLVTDFSSSLCLVPGVVFDRAGWRIGYGKGYYDRFLAEYKGSKIGLAYRSCITDHVPAGRNDVKVDLLICEKGAMPVK